VPEPLPGLPPVPVPVPAPVPVPLPLPVPGEEPPVAVPSWTVSPSSSTAEDVSAALKT
jgi:hypothetical protein